jgi:hypothetical protein
MGFGPQQAPQAAPAMSWGDYIKAVQGGQTGAPGQPAAYPGGPSIPGAPNPVTSTSIPSPPINYGAIHALLNSGVLNGGTASATPSNPNTNNGVLNPPTPAPKQQNPFQAWLSSLNFGGG